LRLVIDAIPLLFRSAGVKNYLYYWTRRLVRESRDIDVALFPFLHSHADLDHERSLATPFGTFWRLGLFYFLNRIPNDFCDWSDARVDLFHSSKILYPPRKARLTATIHDMTCWSHPAFHTAANVHFEKTFAEKVLRRADALIAVSESTRQDAVRALGLPPEKIHVIHHGIAEEFFAAKPDDAVEFCEANGITRPYLLYVGTIEPRKNIDLLLDAYQGLPPSIRGEVDLVIAGPPGWLAERTMSRMQNPSPGVRYLGYVPQANLPGLVAKALGFVYPSLYEGFGFPVAEAMAAGSPIITSAVSSLPEITKGAAILIDPSSLDDLRSAMDQLVTSPSLRERLTSLGRENSLGLTWQECAKKSMDFFRSL
jgi:glycosyltransferase involved in cell wall biosynthesis